MSNYNSAQKTLFDNDELTLPPKEGESSISVSFSNENGTLYLGDSIEWLKTLESESVDMIFADPPYNIKKADWDKFDSQEKYIEWSMKWIEEAYRVLKKDGTMYVCGFSEILADIKHPSMRFFKSCRWLIWHYKNKANLANDWGRSHESLLCLRKSKAKKFNVDDVRIPYGAHTLKYPSHPQAESSQYGNGKERKDTWVPHPRGAKPKDVIEVPTTCNGMGEKTKHPTQKPEELVRKFVLASSNEGDLVLDPFSGSGTTAVVCEQLGRKWISCDLNREYNEWAADRLKRVIQRPKEEWIQLDRENEERRKSIR
ncbi:MULTISPECIES: DNA-methyltransferase [Vibrio harveyi group]|uniref:DNA-methyltransferase n=1 Tax=Vibrio harveyi group TaxID=717610 RepID=UPI003AF9C062